MNQYQLGIETSLARAGERIGVPMLQRYMVLKDRLSGQYEFVAAKMPSGNNHGPSHIARVLEYLDKLLGDAPLQVLQPYELFLAMMSVLYHDAGMLYERKDHPKKSKEFVFGDPNDYTFDERDRAIIGAAVASHGSSTDIDEQCLEFSSEETIGGHVVRPRVIAALVRLADELDEDFRRADPVVEKRLRREAASEFYWRFCQRIQGIRPHQASLDIRIDVKFRPEDAAYPLTVDGERRSFLTQFARKMAKINRERVTTVKYLPESIRYRRLMVSVKPLDGHETWKAPRDIVWNDNFTASEFVERFPELVAEPVAKTLCEALEDLRVGQLDAATAKLKKMEDILDDLSPGIALKVLFDSACAESLRAERSEDSSRAQEEASTKALEYLRRWIDKGVQGSWRDVGETEQNEIYRMGRDSDLQYVISKRREALIEMLGPERTAFLPTGEPVRYRGGGGGGCLPRGALVATPDGPVAIEALRVGSEVLSWDTGEHGEHIVTTIAKVHAYRGTSGVELNRQFVVSPTQPLELHSWPGQRIEAARLSLGTLVRGTNGGAVAIVDIRHVSEYFEFFAITTNHPSHNFFAHGLVFANKKPFAPD